MKVSFMFMHARLVVLVSAAVATMPTLANAAAVVFNNDIGAGQNHSFTAVIKPGDSIEFRFTALDDFKIDSFAVSGTGTSAEADVRDVRFGLSLPASGLFSTVSSVGDAAAGFGFITGMAYVMDDVFSVFFEDGITEEVGLTLSFDTTAVAAVPLPAAGLLLAPVLLAGAASAFRRRKAAIAAA